MPVYHVMMMLLHVSAKRDAGQLMPRHANTSNSHLDLRDFVDFCAGV